MNAQGSRSFSPGACQRCGGDAFFDHRADESEWRCLQCGRPLVPYSPAAVEARIFKVLADLKVGRR